MIFLRVLLAGVLFPFPSDQSLQRRGSFTVHFQNLFRPLSILSIVSGLLISTLILLNFFFFWLNLLLYFKLIGMGVSHVFAEEACITPHCTCVPPLPSRPLPVPPRPSLSGVLSSLTGSLSFSKLSLIRCTHQVFFYYFQKYVLILLETS